MKKYLIKLISLVLVLILFCSASICSFADDWDIPEVGEKQPFRVHITVNGDTSTQKGVTWYTKTKTESVIQLYANGIVDTKSKINYENVFEFEGNYVHKALITNLTPGTEYSYKLGSENNFVSGKFITDDGNDEAKFVAIADIQASSYENFYKGRKTLDAAYKTMPDSEFYINLGDLTNDSDNEEWDCYDAALTSFNLNTTIAPVAGNHDGLGVWHWFENMFNLDTSESVQTLNGVNYSFDYANAHIAVLNTNDVLSISLSQLKWLKNDMNSTTKDWKIVCMHKTPYTLGKDGKWPDALYLQRSLTKVCDMTGVDLVLSGHDHQYVATKPLKNNKISEDGTRYILCGTAGSKRYEVRPFLVDIFLKTEFIQALTIQKNDEYCNYWNGTDYNSKDQNRIGGCFNTITINGGTLKFESYIAKDTEELLDETETITKINEITISKEQGQNKATFSGNNSTSKAEFYANIIPSFICLATYTFGEWLPKFIYMLPSLVKSIIVYDIF